MKTLHKFLEQEQPAQEPKKEDPKVKQAQSKENMLKKRVLMTKIRAVRGGATGIMASHEPEGEVIEGVMTMLGKKKKEKKAEKAMDAGARAKRMLARKIHAKYVSGSEENVPDDIAEGVFKGPDEIKAANRKWLDRRQKKIEQKHKEGKPVKPMQDYGEEVVHEGNALEKRAKENEKARKWLKKDAKDSGYTDIALKASMSKGAGVSEDKAFNFVVNKLKAKYGDGVLTKGDKMPELSAAQKKKNAEIRAKRAKEDHRDPTEKASDGRYSDRYSNRGSD